MSKNSIIIDLGKDGLIERVHGSYIDDINILKIHNLLIRKIESENERDLYITKSKELIDIYSKIGVKRNIIRFGKKGITKETDDNDPTRLIVISRYVFIIEKYIDVDVFHRAKINNKCPGCGNKIESVDDDSIFVCECGFEKTMFNISNHPMTKTTYHDRDTFVKAMHRFQGKIGPDTDVISDIMINLDTYFTSYSLPTGEQVRKKPLNNKGRKDNTSRDMMFEALSAIGKPIYGHVNLICHKYWGWTLPDLSHYEEQIMIIYDKTQKAWESIPRDRQSNITTQFRLYGILCIIGYPCKAEDFRLVKTRDSQEEHWALWEEMCKQVGYNAKAII